MKEEYAKIEIEMIVFEDQDVITASKEGWEENELHELD